MQIFEKYETDKSLKSDLRSINFHVRHQLFYVYFYLNKHIQIDMNLSIHILIQSY